MGEGGWQDVRKGFAFDVDAAADDDFERAEKSERGVIDGEST